jgi:phage head maturation protease
MSRTGLPPTGQIAHRFASAGPASYDADSHSCTIVISAGAAVQRFYGLEVLRIDRSSVDLSRIASSGVPLLDSHSQAGINAVLGRVDHAWIESGKLLGKVTFASSPQGRLAEKMVATGMLKGVSAGYSVSEWEISDDEGNIIDPEKSQIRWDDDNKLTFTASRWQLLESSLVGIPADQLSAVRSFGGAVTGNATDVRERMLARQRMHERSSAHHDRRAASIDLPAGTAWRRASKVFP